MRLRSHQLGATVVLGCRATLSLRHRYVTILDFLAPIRAPGSTSITARFDLYRLYLCRFLINTIKRGLTAVPAGVGRALTRRRISRARAGRRFAYEMLGVTHPPRIIEPRSYRFAVGRRERAERVRMPVRAFRTRGIACFRRCVRVPVAHSVGHPIGFNACGRVQSIHLSETKRHPSRMANR